MKSLRRLRKSLSRRVSRAFNEISPVIEREIEQAFIDGADTFDKEIVDAYTQAGERVPWEYLPTAETPPAPPWRVAVVPTKPGIRAPKIREGSALDQTRYIDIKLEPSGDSTFFQVVNRDRLEIVLEDVRRDMNLARYGAAQRAGAIYEDIVKRADVMFQTGSYTLQQAVEKAAQEAADKGLNAIEYKDGRRVNVASYVEMALRTSARRAQMTAQGAKRDQWGEYLVISPTLHSTCPTCQPWQGKVLIDDVFASGKPDGKHPLLSEAIKPPSHFLGPNCRHAISSFFEGITEIPTASPWDKTRTNYEAEEKQRYIERQIRAWKRKLAMSLTPETTIKSKAKIREWQDRMREHLHANPQLRRNTQREELLGIVQAEVEAS